MIDPTFWMMGFYPQVFLNIGLTTFSVNIFADIVFWLRDCVRDDRMMDETKYMMAKMVQTLAHPVFWPGLATYNETR